MKRNITVLSSLLLVLALGGCATGSLIKEKITGDQFDEPVIESGKYLKKKEADIKPPAGGPIPVAVYGFTDKTGQRKYSPTVASLSSAVTQGSESYLIKALQDVGQGRWFTVLERVGLDNLIKERQMIRQMRDQYQGKDAKMLPPMMFAGIIMEGGIVGYDSNLVTGGNGMRVFGIGAQTQYQSDTVTVTLRTVSVSTGEVLTSVTITKTVLSYMDKLTVLRFVNDPKLDPVLGANAAALEGEFGGSINESINKAIDIAVQAAVVSTINEGARKGMWSFKNEKSSHDERISQSNNLQSNPVLEDPKPEIKKEEVNVEEKKDVVVQPLAVTEAKTETPPTAPAEIKVEKKESKLFGQRRLKEDAPIYIEEKETSKRIWLFKKGTVVTVKQPGTEGWWKVVNSENQGGWIRTDKLEQL